MAIVNNILIPFDCIIDEDVGLFSVIREKYSNDTVFYMDRIQNIEDEKNLVLNNKYNNPLELILRPEYLSKKDDFYNQFINEEYEDIVQNSIMTKIYEFSRKAISSKMANITFVSFNETQTDILKKVFNNEIFVQIIKSYEDVDVKDYDIVFLKRFDNGLKIKNLKGKYIYILDYTFNYEDKEENKTPILNIKDTLLVGENNVLNTISVF